MDINTLRTHQFLNSAQSFVLIGTLTGIIALLGYLVAGWTGVVVLGALSALFWFATSRINTRFVMRQLGARPLRRAELPTVWSTVAELARRAGLRSVPSLYTVRTPQINAAALGSTRDPAIVMSTGLLRNLSERELAGVLAHEISHVANNDLGVMKLAMFARRAARLVAWMGVILFSFQIVGWGLVSFPALLLMLSAPLIVGILSLSLSRTREFHADMGAVELTGDPRGLASALRKLEIAGRNFIRRMFGVVLPQQQRTHWWLTHPATSDRIQRLMSLVGGRWSASSASRTPSSSTMKASKVASGRFPTKRSGWSSVGPMYTSI